MKGLCLSIVSTFGLLLFYLSKKFDAKQIQQYTQICLLNVSSKIFTKIFTNRIIKIAQRIIKPTQTAFLPGRNIMEGAVILHETLRELHTKKQNGRIFKIYSDKAYNKVTAISYKKVTLPLTI